MESSVVLKARLLDRSVRQGPLHADRVRAPGLAHFCGGHGRAGGGADGGGRAGAGRDPQRRLRVLGGGRRVAGRLRLPPLSRHGAAAAAGRRRRPRGRPLGSLQQPAGGPAQEPLDNLETSPSRVLSHDVKHLSGPSCTPVITFGLPAVVILLVGILLMITKQLQRLRHLNQESKCWQFHRCKLSIEINKCQ